MCRMEVVRAPGAALDRAGIAPSVAGDGASVFDQPA